MGGVHTALLDAAVCVSGLQTHPSVLGLSAGTLVTKHCPLGRRRDACLHTNGKGWRQSGVRYGNVKASLIYPVVSTHCHLV